MSSPQRKADDMIQSDFLEHVCLGTENTGEDICQLDFVRGIALLWSLNASSYAESPVVPPQTLSSCTDFSGEKAAEKKLKITKRTHFLLFTGGCAHKKNRKITKQSQFPVRPCRVSYYSGFSNSKKTARKQPKSPFTLSCNNLSKGKGSLEKK